MDCICIRCPTHGSGSPSRELSAETMGSPEFDQYVQLHVMTALSTFVKDAIPGAREIFLEQGIDKGIVERYTRSVSTLAPEAMAVIITALLVIMGNSDFDVETLRVE